MKISNFHFGSALNGATDQRENAEQNRNSSTMQKDLAEKGAHQNRLACLKPPLERALDRRSCPRSTLGRAPDLEAGVPQICVGCALRNKGGVLQKTKGAC